MRFDVRYYLVAILFIIFDLEIAFLFPWAVSLDRIGVFGLVAMGDLSRCARGRFRLRVAERGAGVGLSEQQLPKTPFNVPEVMEKGFFVTRRRRADELGAHRARCGR